ncbi:MAG TPA: recombinase family protein [Vicinamibacteria bacterium]|jgi:DNA invertase Pin-like site-specific DNA recombinase
MRVGVYVRISRDREGLEVGVQRQEKDCRRLVTERGWTVEQVYSDNDVSATDRRKVRRGYRQMLGDLEAGRLDAVVAYSSSRFYRRVRELDELIDLLETRHAEVATVVSGVINLTTADGRMAARLQAVIDQGEAERIGERSSRAKADLKARGEWLGGGAPAFGYERIRENGKIAHRIIEAEAAVLRDAASRALAGESFNRLSAELNRRGVTTSLGLRWTPSKLRATLLSPFHAGLHADGTRGTWPAILTVDMATLLRAQFKPAPGLGKGRGEKPARAYPLAGLAVCSECGGKLLGSSGAYRCQTRNGGCGKVRIPSWPVDQLVDRALWDRRDVNLAEAERARAAAAVGTEPLVQAIQAAESRREEAREAFAAGEIELADFKAIAQAVNGRIEEAEGQLRELSPAPAERDDRPWSRLLLNIGEAQEFYTRWQRRELTPAEIAELNDRFRAWIESVLITPALRRGRGSAADVPQRVSVLWRVGGKTYFSRDGSKGSSPRGRYPL